MVHPPHINASKERRAHNALYISLKAMLAS